MHWDDLRMLLSVARHGLIARAAIELGSDATTVSRRIQRLESHCGQTLLERHRTGPRLTAAGRRLADRAAAMEAAAEGAELDATLTASAVRVSTAEGFGTWFVADHLPKFLDANPKIRVELVASTGFLSPSKRETDLAILLAKPRKGPLVVRKLSDYSLRLYASQPYVHRTAAPGSVAELRRHPLVGYIPDFLYAPELDYLDEIGTGLNPTVTSSSINAQHRLIAAGAGVGVLPCFMGDADPRLVPVLPDMLVTRSFWLSIHRDVRERPQVRRFVDWLVKVIDTHGASLRGKTDQWRS